MRSCSMGALAFTFWAAGACAPVLAAAPLPMPNEKTLELAIQQCEDFAFGSGDKALAATCNRRNQAAWSTLQMASTSTFPVEYWAACHRAAGGNNGLVLELWAKCVTFAQQQCNQTAKSGGAEWNQCVRAINSRSWIYR